MNSRNDSQNDIPILVLAGGKGTRLQAINPDLPKPMIAVRGKPFLSYLFDHYRHQGFTSFLVSTGYMAEKIESYEWTKLFPDCSFQFFRETTPLGTGGAVRAVFEQMPTLNSCWVVNGDTLFAATLPGLQPKDMACFISMESDAVSDAPPNLLALGDRVIGTIPATSSEMTVRNEKQTSLHSCQHVFDSGTVWLSRDAALLSGQAAPFSFHELMGPAILAGAVAHVKVSGKCYDIGTPERFRRFESYLGELDS